MSDNGDSNDEKSMYDEICRDFLRNVCKRADRCRYRHPSVNETETLGRRTAYTFCHDYQNAGCHRPNCKFLHCTREEEDYYKQMGQLPVRLQQAAALGIGVLPNKLPILKGEVPICKDYLRGECKRSLRCKYRHMTVGVEEYTNVVIPPPRPPSQDKMETFNGTTEFEQYETFEQQPPVQAAAAPPPTHTIINSPPIKRRRPDFEEVALALNGTNGSASAHPTAAAPPGSYEWVRHSIRTPAEYCLLEEENMMLRRKVDELKKQASDLAATNEVLLEQNARFRSSRSSAAVLARSMPSIVKVTQVVTPTISGTSAIARTATLPHQAIPLAATSIPPPQLTAPVNGHLVMSMSHQRELIVSMSQQAIAPRMAAMPIQAALPIQAAAALNPCPAQPGAAINSAVPPPLVPASITLDSLTVPVSNILPGGAGADMSGASITAILGQQNSITQLMNSVGGAAGTSRSLVSYPIMSHSHSQRSSLSMPICSLTLPTNSPNMSISTIAVPASSLSLGPPMHNTLAMPNGNLG